MQVYTDTVFWASHSRGRTVKEYEKPKLIFNLPDAQINQEQQMEMCR